MHVAFHINVCRPMHSTKEQLTRYRHHLQSSTLLNLLGMKIAQNTA